MIATNCIKKRRSSILWQKWTVNKVVYVEIQQYTLMPFCFLFFSPSHRNRHWHHVLKSYWRCQRIPQRWLRIKHSLAPMRTFLDQLPDLRHNRFCNMSKTRDWYSTHHVAFLTFSSRNWTISISPNAAAHINGVNPRSSWLFSRALSIKKKACLKFEHLLSERVSRNTTSTL